MSDTPSTRILVGRGSPPRRHRGSSLIVTTDSQKRRTKSGPKELRVPSSSACISPELCNTLRTHGCSPSVVCIQIFYIRNDLPKMSLCLPSWRALAPVEAHTCGLPASGRRSEANISLMNIVEDISAIEILPAPKCPALIKQTIEMNVS